MSGANEKAAAADDDAVEIDKLGSESGESIETTSESSSDPTGGSSGSLIEQNEVDEEEEHYEGEDDPEQTE